MIEAREAVAILTFLINGIDPFTGSDLPKSGPIRHPDTIEALKKAIKALEKSKTHEEKVDNLPKNIGKKWTKQEEKELIKLFRIGKNMDELALHFERTKNNIRNKLFKLGEINFEKETK